MAAHAAFHAALAAAAGSPVLERLRRQVYGASELYRCWAGTLPHHPARAHVADEHKAIFDAALAREADLAVDLLTQHLEAIAANVGTTDPKDIDAVVEDRRDEWRQSSRRSRRRARHRRRDPR